MLLDGLEPRPHNVEPVGAADNVGANILNAAELAKPLNDCVRGKARPCIVPTGVSVQTGVVRTVCTQYKRVCAEDSTNGCVLRTVQTGVW